MGVWFLMCGYSRTSHCCCCSPWRAFPTPKASPAALQPLTWNFGFVLSQFRGMNGWYNKFRVFVLILVVFMETLGGQPDFQGVQAALPHLSHPRESFVWAAVTLSRLANYAHLKVSFKALPYWSSLDSSCLSQAGGQPGSCCLIWSLLLTRNAVSSPKQRSGHTLHILSSCITSGGVLPAIWTSCTETFEGKNGIASGEIKYLL